MATAPGGAGFDPNTTPIAPPPPGVTPDFDDAYNRQAIGYGVYSLSLVILVVFVALRFYAKIFVVRKLWWDDWFCLVAFLLCVGNTGLQIAVLAGGSLGPPNYDVPVSAVTTPAYGKEFIATFVLYPITQYFIRMSILLLVYHIFSIRKAARYLVYFGIFICTVFYLISFILANVWCDASPGQNPSEAIATYQCQVLGQRLSVGITSFNLATDVYLIAVPAAFIWSLNRPTGKKLATIIVFAFGLVATALSCVNLYYRVIRTTSTWNGLSDDIVNVYEMNLGLTASCMPILPSLSSNPRIKRMLSASNIFSKISNMSPLRGSGASRGSKNSNNSGEDVERNGNSSDSSSPFPLKDLPSSSERRQGGNRDTINSQYSLDDREFRKYQTSTATS